MASKNQQTVERAVKEWFPHAVVQVLPRLLVPYDLGSHREVVVIGVDDVIVGRGEVDAETPKSMQTSIDKLIVEVQEYQTGKGQH